MIQSPTSFSITAPNKVAGHQINGEGKPNMWSSLLDSVASGKRVPEKSIILLGGSPDTQKEFIETLASDSTRKIQDRRRRKPPIANGFALGYTYQDILDADQEDILARLSVHTLSDPSPTFAPLLQPLLTASSIPNTLLVLLLDWSEPWNWIRQLRSWIHLLHVVLPALDDDARSMMQELMQEWEQRRRGGAASDPNHNTTIGSENHITVPLGPGEWDEALGLPLAVVCHNADQIDLLENERGWREETFDFVLQFLRTILLKHGASLIYTSNSLPNSLPTLIQSTLGIHSLLKRQPLRHNVIDRDRILIPPNWDSWGKIRVLREGFDVEGISQGWSIDIQTPLPTREVPQEAKGANLPEALQHQKEPAPSPNGPIFAYEEVIKDQNASSELNMATNSSTLEIVTPSMQTFLAGQLSAMEKLKAEEELAAGKQSTSNSTPNSSSYARLDSSSMTQLDEPGRVTEHIGPVQFNVGGIQVDAEDVLQRLREREQEADEVLGTKGPAVPATPESKTQNEALASFFAGLMKRGGGASGQNSPRTGPV